MMWNTLVHAVQNGDEKGFKAMLAVVEDANELRGNPEARDYGSRSPLLHQACDAGHAGIVKLLLEKLGENDLMTRDLEGKFPLQIACYRGRHEVFELLVPLYTREQIMEMNKKPPHLLTHGCRNIGPKAFISMLQKLKSKDFLTTDEYGNTLLHTACSYGGIEIIKFLMDASPPEVITMINIYGDTPLHCAASYNEGHHAINMILARGNCDVLFIKNKMNSTPLDVAIKCGRAKCVKCIISYTTDPNTSSNEHDYIEDKECHMLFSHFKFNPEKIRRTVREELGLEINDAAEVFSLIVGLCDQHFTRKPPSDPERFFNIVEKLPMELQMIICNRLFESQDDIIKTKNIEEAILRMF